MTDIELEKTHTLLHISTEHYLPDYQTGCMETQ